MRSWLMFFCRTYWEGDIWIEHGRVIIEDVLLITLRLYVAGMWCIERTMCALS